MSTKPTIMKFGGTSVADASAFTCVAKIVRAQQDVRPVIVVSAMSGFTDALLRCFDLSVAGRVDEAASALEEHLARHIEVVDMLDLTDAAQFELKVNEARAGLRVLPRDARQTSASIASIKDEFVSFGEQLSAELLALVLRALDAPGVYVDARRVLVTDDEYGQANPLMRETARRAETEIGPLLEKGKVPVLGGFIAATAAGATTTLGRGGSDYSAAIIGAALDAREIQIWSDVTGVLTADPRVVPEARTVPVLSYQEAAELAYFGAKVLHPKTIQPAVEHGIPVRVCNSRAPLEPGTAIVAESEAAPQTVKAIAHKNGITTLQVTSTRMLGAYGFLRALFEVFDRHRTVVDVVTTSEVSVSLSIDDARTLKALLPDLEQFGSVQVERHRTIISVIGEGLRNTPGIAARVFSTISDINISMISFGSSSINLTFMVEEEHSREAITRLHRVCFESDELGSAVPPSPPAAKEVAA